MKDKKEDVLDPWNSPTSEEEWAKSVDKQQEESNKFHSSLANSNSAKPK